MNSSAFGACPASAVVQAARIARTPLAIAEAGADDPTIMFVNESFAALLDTDPAAWIGRPLSALAAPAPHRFAAGGTTRLELVLAGGLRLPAALSIAAVPGPGGKPFCLLCSLVAARGDGASQAIARDADLLAQVAAAAGELVCEAASASPLSPDDTEAGAAHAAHRSAA